MPSESDSLLLPASITSSTMALPCAFFAITILISLAATSVAQSAIPLAPELPPTSQPTTSTAPTPTGNAPVVAASSPLLLSSAASLTSSPTSSTTSPQRSPTASAPSPVASPPAPPLAPEFLPSNLIPSEPPVDPPPSGACGLGANAVLLGGMIIGGAAMILA